MPGEKQTVETMGRGRRFRRAFVRYPRGISAPGGKGAHGNAVRTIREDRAGDCCLDQARLRLGGVRFAAGNKTPGDHTRSLVEYPKVARTAIDDDSCLQKAVLRPLVTEAVVSELHNKHKALMDGIDGLRTAVAAEDIGHLSAELALSLSYFASELDRLNSQVIQHFSVEEARLRTIIEHGEE